MEGLRSNWARRLVPTDRTRMFLGSLTVWRRAGDVHELELEVGIIPQLEFEVALVKQISATTVGLVLWQTLNRDFDFPFDFRQSEAHNGPGRIRFDKFEQFDR
jgi:hypothetical protein